MGQSKCAVGVDFGTLSGRVVIVDVTGGRELATAVREYRNGVIDEALPRIDIRLEPDRALQAPSDNLEVSKRANPEGLKESKVNAENVVSVGIDLTACTMLPARADGTR